MPASTMSELRKRFCEEYIIDLNGAAAYRRANGKAKDAAKAASQMLSFKEVQEYIYELRKGQQERTQVNADYVLMRLSEIDQMDAADIFDDQGALLPIREWPKVWRQYISGMDVAEMFEGSGDERKVIGVLRKIKWPDKLKNLELLGKHVDIQAWKERVEHDASDRLAEVIMSARRRERSSD